MTEPTATAETIRFPVAGMTCGSCVNRITRSLRKLDGVTKVIVDLRRETATVRREPALVSNAALAAAVAGAGYEADLASAETILESDGRSLLERLTGPVPPLYRILRKACAPLDRHRGASQPRSH